MGMHQERGLALYELVDLNIICKISYKAVLRLALYELVDLNTSNFRFMELLAV